MKGDRGRCFEMRPAERPGHVLVTAGREYWEAACMIRVRFGGLGVGVDDYGEVFFGSADPA